MGMIELRGSIYHKTVIQSDFSLGSRESMPQSRMDGMEVDDLFFRMNHPDEDGVLGITPHPDFHGDRELYNIRLC